MAGKVIPMTIAKASQEDFRALVDLFQLIDEYLDYGTYTPDHEQPPENVDDGRFVELLRHAFRQQPGALTRVLYGCQALIREFCDPESDTLLYRPDILEFVKLKILTERLDDMESERAPCDSATPE